MLENLFLSERRLVNAIVRVMLEYMKDVYFHEIKCYLQCRIQDFNVFEFCLQRNLH